MKLLLLQLFRVERQFHRPVVDALPASIAAYQEVFSRVLTYPRPRFAGIAPVEANRETHMRSAKE